MSIENELDIRNKARLKHLEDPKFRRWSDVTPKSSIGYRARLESSMLASYLAGKFVNGVEADHTDVNVIRRIEANLDNPEINWEGIYAYLDERLSSVRYDDETKTELDTLARLLKPYRDRICPPSTFIGY